MDALSEPRDGTCLDKMKKREEREARKANMIIKKAAVTRDEAALIAELLQTGSL